MVGGEIKGKIRADGPQEEVGSRNTRADGPQEEVGSRNTTVQQQEPRALQILNGRNMSVQECGVLANSGLQAIAPKRTPVCPPVGILKMSGFTPF